MHVTFLGGVFSHFAEEGCVAAGSRQGWERVPAASLHFSRGDAM